MSSILCSNLVHFPASVVKIFPQKNFLYFFLKKPALKKFIFSQKKLLLYLRKRNFLIFSSKKFFSHFKKWKFLGLSLNNFRRKLLRAPKIKKPSLKRFLIFWKMQLSSPKLKKPFIFFLKKISYIFRGNFQSPKNSYVSGKIPVM